LCLRARICCFPPNLGASLNNSPFPGILSPKKQKEIEIRGALLVAGMSVSHFLVFPMTLLCLGACVPHNRWVVVVFDVGRHKSTEEARKQVPAQGPLGVVVTL
jgi:hypothetical protein